MRYNFCFFIFLYLFAFQVSNSQDYKKEFYKIQQASDTLAKTYIDSLVVTNIPNAKAFSLSAQAYLLVKEKKYVQIDSLFELTFKELKKIGDGRLFLEEKLHVLYFYGYYLITKHDTKIVNDIINQGLEHSLELDDIEMQIRFQNLQARYYNLIELREQALKMTREAIQKLKLSQNQLDDWFFKDHLTTMYLNGANRSASLYLLDSIKYRTYVDTTEAFLKNASKFIKTYNVNPNPIQQIQLMGISGAVEFYKKNYHQSIEYYEKCLIIASNNGLKKKIFQSKYKIAECNFFLGNYSTAKQVFDELSQDELNQYRLVINRIRINYYYALIYQELGDTEKSLKYSKAFNDESHSHYRDMSEEKLNSFITNELKSKQKIINDLDIANKKVRQKDQYIAIGLIALGVVLITVFFYVKRQKNHFKVKVNKLLTHIDSLENNDQYQTVTIEEEKAKTILTKLKKIEKQQLFTSQNYSLNKVAKKIGSNSTYVSQAVNTYWNKSFTEYTNELRINYILLKIKNDKQYQKFKLEAIAQSVGYKSLRSFNKHFKAQTGLSPKSYITLLKKDNS
ncbi:helix-turn-helix domain-containing protein [Winogradskyella flava]|uniref:helix-turn-helix domain-containing protein n=1 Tax=Winogradskyella flava TaxID=1884876 RepID=UPI00249392F0|nr:helix-turn-helix domain-containing protein [Winogradskyella flava]